MNTKSTVLRIDVVYVVRSTHVASWIQHLNAKWELTGHVDAVLADRPAEARALISKAPPSEIQIGSALRSADSARQLARMLVASGGIGTKIIVKVAAKLSNGATERLPDQSISIDGIDMPVMPQLEHPMLA